MEDVKLALYYTVFKCNDGYITLIGCQTIDRDDVFTVTGIGLSEVGWKSLYQAKKSASDYIGVKVEDIKLFPLSFSVKWQLPGMDFESLDKTFHEL